MSGTFRILCLACVTCVAGCQSEKPIEEPGATPPDLSVQTENPSGNGAAGSDLPVSAFRFREMTADSGVKFTYRNGEEAGNFAILESLGGGLSSLDFDRDGLEDLCIAGGGRFQEHSILPEPTGLFRASGHWKWNDVSDVSGVSENSFYSHGIARTDYDCDGMPDFLVTGYGGVELFHNLGDGTFERLQADVGLTDALWSSSAAWGDLNGDQWPDVYVAHYVDWSWDNDPICRGGPGGSRDVCPPKSYTGLSDVVYYSNGDGTFRDATQEAGLTPEGKGLGVLIADFDVDNDLDVYVTNDTVSNFLYENHGKGKLADVSLSSGASLSNNGRPDGSMGVDACDYNNDGLPDLWVVNYERETNALYQNAGALVFRHVSQRMGISALGMMSVGWGTSCQDFDHDGDEDLFVSNGHVIRYPVNAPLNQPPMLLNNDGAKRFINVADQAGDWFRAEHMGRGAISADFDDDGLMDLAVTHTGQPVALLRNEAQAAKNWVRIRLVGTVSSREPTGALISLTGASPQTRFLKGGGSYSGSQPETLNFAIPDGKPAELQIRWPSGKQEIIRIDALQQTVWVCETADGASRVVAANGDYRR